MAFTNMMGISMYIEVTAWHVVFGNFTIVTNNHCLEDESLHADMV